MGDKPALEGALAAHKLEGLSAVVKSSDENNLKEKFK